MPMPMPAPSEGHQAHKAGVVAGHAFCPACGTRLEPDTGPGGRPACPQCGFVRYEDPKVATGVVAERDGQILLVRRNHEPMLGRWSFPSGFVDAGEAVSDAAVREVREETGVEVRIDRLLGVYSRAGDTVVFIAYAGVIVDGTPEPSDEAFEVGLFAPEAMPELAFPHDDAIVAAWLGASEPGGEVEDGRRR
jgi:ADP-ribose pyrophosphatase YjhB (NUDIX family)